MLSGTDETTLRAAIAAKKSQVITLENGHEIAVFKNKTDQTTAIIDGRNGKNLAQFPDVLEPFRKLGRACDAIEKRSFQGVIE